MQSRDTVIDLGEALHDAVHRTAEVAGNQAVAHAQSHVDHGGHQRNAKADPGALPDSRPDVPAQGVGAEPVVYIVSALLFVAVDDLEAGGGGHFFVAVKNAYFLKTRDTGREVLLRQILVGVAVLVHARADDGEEGNDHDEHQRNQRALVADEPLVNVLPVALGGEIRVNIDTGGVVFQQEVILLKGVFRNLRHGGRLFLSKHHFFLPPSFATRIRGSIIP